MVATRPRPASVNYRTPDRVLTIMDRLDRVDRLLHDARTNAAQVEDKAAVATFVCLTAAIEELRNCWE